jgi:hypothetical protein
MLTLFFISQSIEIYSSQEESNYEGKEETNDYLWLWKKGKKYTISIRILQPEGAIVEIQKENNPNPIYKADIPTTYTKTKVSSRDEGFYRIIVSKENYSWSKKFEIKSGYEYTLYVKSLSTKEEKEEYNDYYIIRKPSSETVLKIVEPKGANAEIYKENSTVPIHKSDIPTSKSLNESGYYKVIVTNESSKWEGKVEVKKNYENILYVKNLAPISKPTLKPISEESFKSLIQNLKSEISEFTRIEILKTAVSKNYFLVRHLEEIIDQFTSELNKEEVVKIVYPKIIDKENIHQIFSKFTSSLSKENIREWIENYDSGNVEKEGWK